MKTAVYIPEPIFHKATQWARRQGLSVDDLYTRAVDEYIRRHEPQDEQVLVEQINAVCRQVDTSLDDGFKALRDASLPKEQW